MHSLNSNFVFISTFWILCPLFLSLIQLLISNISIVWCYICIFGQKEGSFRLKECAFSIALAIGLFTGIPQFSWAAHASPAPVLPDLALLISGPPIKDPGALLRYALPIDNKAIREVQKPLEDITDSLKIAGVKALDSVERVSKFHTWSD